MNKLITIFFLFIISMEVRASEYTAEKFFEDINPSEIEAEEALSNIQKDEVIKSRFLVNKIICDTNAEFTSGRWYVEKSNNRTLLLSQCGGGSVELFVFKKKEGGSIVANVSILGNHGQSQSFKFYEISQNGRILGPVDAKSLGVADVKDNDFLEKNQEFPSGENYAVPRYISDDGKISAYPWTRMEPRWDDKNIIRSIEFVWDGYRFKRVDHPLPASTNNAGSTSGPNM